MNWKEFNSFVQEHEFISLSHEIENVEIEKVVVDENVILLMENYDGMMLMYRMTPESFCHAELSGDVLNVSILNSKGIESTFGLKVVVKLLYESTSPRCEIPFSSTAISMPFPKDHLK